MLSWMNKWNQWSIWDKTRNPNELLDFYLLVSICFLLPPAPVARPALQAALTCSSTGGSSGFRGIFDSTSSHCGRLEAAVSVATPPLCTLMPFVPWQEGGTWWKKRLFCGIGRNQLLLRPQKHRWERWHSGWTGTRMPLRQGFTPGTEPTVKPTKVALRQ